jgi:hypothetical protein
LVPLPVFFRVPFLETKNLRNLRVLHVLTDELAERQRATFILFLFIHIPSSESVVSPRHGQVGVWEVLAQQRHFILRRLHHSRVWLQHAHLISGDSGGGGGGSIGQLGDDPFFF